MKEKRLPLRIALLLPGSLNDGGWNAAAYAGLMELQDEKKIAKDLLVCEDWVSGAGIFASTEYYKKYISLLEGRGFPCPC